MKLNDLIRHNPKGVKSEMKFIKRGKNKDRLSDRGGYERTNDAEPGKMDVAGVPDAPDVGVDI